MQTSTHNERRRATQIVADCMAQGYTFEQAAAAARAEIAKGR